MCAPDGVKTERNAALPGPFIPVVFWGTDWRDGDSLFQIGPVVCTRCGSAEASMSRCMNCFPTIVCKIVLLDLLHRLFRWTKVTATGPSFKTILTRSSVISSRSLVIVSFNLTLGQGYLPQGNWPHAEGVDLWSKAVGPRSNVTCLSQLVLDPTSPTQGRFFRNLMPLAVVLWWSMTGPCRLSPCKVSRPGSVFPGPRMLIQC